MNKIPTDFLIADSKTSLVNEFEYPYTLKSLKMCRSYICFLFFTGNNLFIGLKKKYLKPNFKYKNLSCS